MEYVDYVQDGIEFELRDGKHYHCRNVLHKKTKVVHYPWKRILTVLFACISVSALIVCVRNQFLSINIANQPVQYDTLHAAMENANEHKVAAERNSMALQRQLDQRNKELKDSQKLSEQHADKVRGLTAELAALKKSSGDAAVNANDHKAAAEKQLDQQNKDLKESQKLSDQQGDKIRALHEELAALKKACNEAAIKAIEYKTAIEKQVDQKSKELKEFQKLSEQQSDKIRALTAELVASKNTLGEDAAIELSTPPYNILSSISAWMLLLGLNAAILAVTLSIAGKLSRWSSSQERQTRAVPESDQRMPQIHAILEQAASEKEQLCSQIRALQNEKRAELETCTQQLSELIDGFRLEKDAFAHFSDHNVATTEAQLENLRLISEQLSELVSRFSSLALAAATTIGTPATACSDSHLALSSQPAEVQEMDPALSQSLAALTASISQLSSQLTSQHEASCALHSEKEKLSVALAKSEAVVGGLQDKVENLEMRDGMNAEEVASLKRHVEKHYCELEAGRATIAVQASSFQKLTDDHHQASASLQKLTEQHRTTENELMAVTAERDRLKAQKDLRPVKPATDS